MMIDHAKGFTLCEYLLKQQGVEFVLKITRKYPNLVRRYIQNPSLAPETRFLSQLLKQTCVKAPAVKDTRLSNPVLSKDPSNPQRIL